MRPSWENTMRRRFLDSLLAAAFLASSSSTEAMGKRTYAPRIIQGKPAATGSYPWVVAIMADHEGSPYHRCGGTLIAPNKVLTAAHCVRSEGDSLPLEALTVIAGMTHYTEPEIQEVGISTVSIHPKYNPNTFYHDVAVITLATPLRDLESVSLAEMGDDKKGAAWVAGWGSTDFYGGTKSVDLLEGTVEVTSAVQCQRELRKWAKAPGEKPSSKLCTYNKPSGICDGDSGGPLFRILGGKAVQIGITSHYLAEDCSKAGYTRIVDKTIKAFIRDQL